MTNEQLCTLAKKGDVQAQGQLARNNLEYIQKTANEYTSAATSKTVNWESTVMT